MVQHYSKLHHRSLKKKIFFSSKHLLILPDTTDDSHWDIGPTSRDGTHMSSITVIQCIAWDGTGHKKENSFPLSAYSEHDPYSKAVILQSVVHSTWGWTVSTPKPMHSQVISSVCCVSPVYAVLTFFFINSLPKLVSNFCDSQLFLYLPFYCI